MTDEIFELTDEVLSCRLHPVREMTIELLAIHAEGSTARAEGIADFLNPYWPQDIEIKNVDPETRDKMNAWWRGWHAREHDMETVDDSLACIADLLVDDQNIGSVGRTICFIQHTSGLPAETAFRNLEEQDIIKYTPREKAIIMHHYLQDTVTHKRSSGISGKRLRQIQEGHRDIILTILATGKFSSVYHMLA